MSAPTKCQKCGGEMQEGFISDKGFGEYASAMWVAHKPEKTLLSGVNVEGKVHYDIQSYRCMKCGLLESYAKRQFEKEA